MSAAANAPWGEEQAAATRALGEVSVLAQHLTAAERKVLDAELALAAAKEDARRLREEALPGAMEELGMTEVTLSDGSKITVGQEVYCSIPVDSRDDAHQWLEDHEFGGLIKTVVALPFGRDPEEKEALAALLATLTRLEYTYTIKKDVHAQTLKAWLKEQLRDGDPFQVPLQLFGARPVTVAKVKLPKGI